MHSNSYYDPRIANPRQADRRILSLPHLPGSGLRFGLHCTTVHYKLLLLLLRLLGHTPARAILDGMVLGQAARIVSSKPRVYQCYYYYYYYYHYFFVRVFAKMKQDNRRVCFPLILGGAGDRCFISKTLGRGVYTTLL